MRIDLFNSAATQIINEQNAQQTGSKGTSKAELSNTVDHATLSPDSVSLQSLVATSLKTPDVRHDKVDSLRQAIDTAQYHLDPAKIAASIIDEHA